MTKKAAPLKRPFQVLYYHDFKTEVHDSQGHAATERGAIRASVVRVFDRQYAYAEILEAGVLIYTVARSKGAITVHLGGSLRS